MKRIISLLLALSMVFLFVGCQNPAPTRGTIDEDVYKNDFLKFEFTKPASWVYYTDEEIAKAINASADVFNDENLKEALKNNPTVYDMMVVDSITRTNINIGYENLSKSFSRNITVEQYIEALKEQFGKINEMNVIFPDEYTKAKLGETEFTRVVCKTVAGGMYMTQVYYLRKTDNYMCFVIATVTNDYTVSEIEAMFK